VGSIIDGAAWPEIVGTVAGDDTLFVAVGGPRAATGLRRRIGELVGKRERRVLCALNKKRRQEENE